ncbi:MAG TPA: DUF4856 domain-containing protein [Ferruginibacter sp.]|jgi:hypothetical protein|nr:DUF4856 domain-containing protein [Ferruginibacter sp.]
MKKITFPVLVLSVTIFCWSCKKGSTPSIAAYTDSTTYNYPNVNYNNQLIILAMADQLVAEINTANAIPNVTVTAQTLTNMFNNSGSPFNDSALNLNGSGLSLKNYCSAAMQADLINYFDSISVYSQSTVAAAQGVTGVAPSSVTPTKKYLLSPNGVFYSQVVKKAIMGMCAYQIANVYMADSINTTTDTTTLAHYWDAAFGFFGVPVNFPTNVTGLRYFGSYSNQVNAGLNSNSSIMNAFLKGRAAISHNDIVTMKIQANILINTFDSLDAAAIVQEMHETETNIAAGDTVAALGTLSESLGFVRNLQYNSGSRVITSTQITQLLALYDGVNPNTPDLYNFINVLLTQTPGPQTRTEAIAEFVGQIYGFNSTELPLL